MMAETERAYSSCVGVGQPVVLRRVGDVIGPGRVGGDGEGECSVCGRVVAQRGGIAKRHKDKRSPTAQGPMADGSEGGHVDGD